MPETPTPAIQTEEEVMFFDTDCGGVVHNLAYLRFIETARTRLAALMGMELRAMADSREYPVLLRTEIDYRAPAVLGDRLRIHGELERIRKIRFWCSFRIVRPCDGALLVTCRQELALIRMPDGKPLRLPPEWFEKYAHLSEGNSKSQAPYSK